MTENQKRTKLLALKAKKVELRKVQQALNKKFYYEFQIRSPLDKVYLSHLKTEFKENKAIISRARKELLAEINSLKIIPASIEAKIEIPVVQPLSQDKREILEELKELNVRLREQQHKSDLEFYKALPLTPLVKKKDLRIDYMNRKAELNIWRSAVRKQIKDIYTEIQAENRLKRAEKLACKKQRLLLKTKKTKRYDVPKVSVAAKKPKKKQISTHKKENNFSLQFLSLVKDTLSSERY